MTTDSQHTARSILRNSAYGAATWVIPLILGVVATPVIVRNLGVEAYGIYALVLGFVGYSFSFGLGRVLTKYIAEFRANGESEKIPDVVTATLIVGCVVGVVGAGSIVFTAEWLVAEVLLIDPAARAQTVHALYVAAAVVFASIFNQAFGSALQGIHRFDIYSRIFNASGIGQIGGTIVLAWLGYGLITLLAWNLISVTLTAIVTLVAVRRYIEEFGIRLPISKHELGIVTRYSLGIIGYQLTANALVLFERAWLTRQLGSESLAYYVVAFTPGLYLQGFVGSLVLLLVPLASEFENRKGELLAIYRKATRLITSFVFLATTLLVVDSRGILTVWMGQDFAENATSILIVLSISFGIVAILSVSWQMKEGLGVPRFNFAASTAALIVGIPAMVIFTEQFGAVGTAAGRLAAFGILGLSLIHFERWSFGQIQAAFWAGLLFRCAVCSVVMAAILIAIQSSLPTGWLSLLLSAVSGTAAFLGCAWLTGLVAVEEKSFFRRAVSLFS